MMPKNSSKASDRAAEESNTIDCLAGGGEMGALMRGHDWSTTPLGAVNQWPQSLCTAVSICLNSRYPMLIWWGPVLMAFGGLLSLSDRRLRVGAPKPARKAAGSLQAAE